MLDQCKGRVNRPQQHQLFHPRMGEGVERGHPAGRRIRFGQQQGKEQRIGSWQVEFWQGGDMAGDLGNITARP